jgi:single-stranded-DNA-specific exonuclease
MLQRINFALLVKSAYIKKMHTQWVFPKKLSTNTPPENTMDEIVLSILQRRGFSRVQDIQTFMDKTLQGIHDPSLMKDMDKAVSRLLFAIEQKEKILVYGDYDVDGITATSLLIHFLRRVDAVHDFYIPHRVSEGYGLSLESMDKAAKNGVKLIITVDTGISSKEVIEYANHLGLDVIITDHHRPPAILPKACAILNPNQEGCTYPNKHLCGVGVAFKLAHACLKKIEKEENGSKQFLKSLLDFVTLGTVADVCSLLGENRSMVAYGLKSLSKSFFPGIRTLLDQSNLSDQNLTTGILAFRVIPKLNAAGRTDHAKISVKLLTEWDLGLCFSLFSKLELCNKERREIEQNDLQRAIAIVEAEQIHLKNRILVVSHPSFHPGVNGIVASRLTERYHLPTIVMAQGEKGELKGSARTYAGINIFNCIDSCKHLCVSFGGHLYAAGLTLLPEKLDAFKKEVGRYAEENFSREMLQPLLTVDAHLDFHQMTENFLSDLKSLEPFGMGNPDPLFHTRCAVLLTPPKILKSKHLKLHLIQEGITLEAIGFNLLDRIPFKLKVKDRIDFVYRISSNLWQGEERIQLEIVDLKLSE